MGEKCSGKRETGKCSQTKLPITSPTKQNVREGNGRKSTRQSGKRKPERKVGVQQYMLLRMAATRD